jgi:hypothetical protein
MRLRKLSTAVLGPLAFSAFCTAGSLGCSGASSPGVPGASSDVAPASPTPAAGSPSPSYTLDDVCERTSAAICALEKPCCEIGGGYSDADCVARQTSQCAADVAEARAGREAFHPERIDRCLAALPKVLRACTFTFDVLYDAISDFAECRVFDGALPEGSACERDGQCKANLGAFDMTSCDGTSHTCKTLHLLSQGEGCVLGDGMTALCGAGLYCDVSFATQPLTGTCKPATPIGARCTKSAPIDLECGLGNYCEGATGLCTAAKTAGAPCKADLECASFKCGGAACTAPKPIVSREVCMGG